MRPLHVPRFHGVLDHPFHISSRAVSPKGPRPQSRALPLVGPVPCKYRGSSRGNSLKKSHLHTIIMLVDLHAERPSDCRTMVGLAVYN